MVSLGDAGDLSPNASVMLKVSILAAWAELQIAAARQAYLNDVLKPYRWLLGPFWVGALRDYAGLRTDPEMGAAVGVGMETGVARDVLLPVSLSTFDTVTRKLIVPVLRAVVTESRQRFGNLVVGFRPIYLRRYRRSIDTERQRRSDGPVSQS